MKGINLEWVNKKYVQILFDEGVDPKRPVCANNRDTNKPLLLFIETNRKTELWSSEYNYGLLGQGDD